MSDRIYLEDHIAGIIPGDGGFRCGVTERRIGVPAKDFLRRALWPDPVGFGHTRSQGKRRASHKRSGRCPTNCRQGWLRRRGGHRFEQGQVASPRFGRILQGSNLVRWFRILFAIDRGRSDALDGRGVSALGGRRKQRWLRAPYHRQIRDLSRPS